MYTVAQYVDELTEDEGYTEAFETFEEAQECFNELLKEYNNYEVIKLNEHKIKFINKNNDQDYIYVELLEEEVPFEEEEEE